MASKKKRKVISKICKFFVLISLILTCVFFVYLINLNMIPNKYLIIFGVILVVIYAFLCLLIIPRKIKSGIKIFSTFIMVLISSFLFYCGVIYIDRAISFIDKINDAIAQKEEYYISTLSSSSDSLLKDLMNKKIGVYVINDSSNSIKAIDVLKKVIPFEECKYSDIISMFEDLQGKKIDAVLINGSIDTVLSGDLSYLEIDLKRIDKIMVPIVTNDVVKVVDVTTQPFNVYIAGGDAYGSINNVTNTDVNMVATIDPVNNKILLTSIPRDYYVNLVGLGDDAWDKLTHAGYYGIETSIKSVEKLLDIDINYYVKVNFSTVEEIVDAIGGIDVYNDFEFCVNGMNWLCYNKGNVHLDGYNALMFARERHAFIDGDIQRNKNQQKVLKAIINKVSSSTVLINRYSNILDSISDCFVTNMDNKSISRLVKFQLSGMHGWKMDGQNLTGTGISAYTYSYPNMELYVMSKNNDSVQIAINKIKSYIGNL